MAHLLEVKDLVTRFYSDGATIHAVNGISYTLDEGESLAIVGESGSGKSVGVMSLMGLIRYPPGRVEGGRGALQGPRSAQALARRDPQGARAGDRDGLPGPDDLAQPRPAHRPATERGAAPAHGHGQGAGRERAIAELLALVGLPNAADRLKDFPFQFSGGQRQRIMIAMALACDPSLLIADEPTTALDVTIQAQIVELVKELQQKLGMAIIWISHNLALVAGMVDKVIVMYSGYIVEQAPVDDLYERPLHPYTLGLLHAIPTLEQRNQERLASIEGMPPDLRKPVTGCPFAPRCPYARRKVPASHPAPASRGPAAHLRLLARRRAARHSHLWRQAMIAPMPSKTLVEVKNLKVHFPIRRGLLRKQVGAVRAVDDISFEVYEGETLGLVGESGCGKSTTGLAVLKLLEATAGEVRFRGQDVTHLSEAQMRPLRRHMMMVFQDPYSSLNPRMTVGNIIGEPLGVHRVGTPAERARARAGTAAAGGAEPQRSSTAIRTSSPAGSASASAWPAHWPPTRRSSWPTSRSPRSTCPSRRRWST